MSSRAYYLANREAVLERSRAYYVANRERLKAKRREAYWSDPERHRKRVAVSRSTLRGMVGEVYGSMKQCSDGDRLEFNFEELVSWAMDEGFPALYKAWERGSSSKPTIVLDDVRGGHILDNLVVCKVDEVRSVGEMGAEMHSISVRLLALDGAVLGEYRSLLSCSDCVGISVRDIRSAIATGSVVAGMRFEMVS